MKRFLSFLFLVLFTVGAHAQLVTFRGVNHCGIYPAEKNLLKEWPAGRPEKLWVVNDAGKGNSSALVSDGFIYTAGLTEDEKGELLTCYKLDGTKVWQVNYGGAWTTFSPRLGAVLRVRVQTVDPRRHLASLTVHNVRKSGTLWPKMAENVHNVCFFRTLCTTYPYTWAFLRTEPGARKSAPASLRPIRSAATQGVWGIRPPVIGDREHKNSLSATLKGYFCTI